MLESVSLNNGRLPASTAAMAVLAIASCTPVTMGRGASDASLAQRVFIDGTATSATSATVDGWLPASDPDPWASLGANLEIDASLYWIATTVESSEADRTTIPPTPTGGSAETEFLERNSDLLPLVALVTARLQALFGEGAVFLELFDDPGEDVQQLFVVAKTTLDVDAAGAMFDQFLESAEWGRIAAQVGSRLSATLQYV